ncbi:MAG: hypothetical protein ACI86M_002508, partial [Saprospiraceae bacterium]
YDIGALFTASMYNSAWGSDMLNPVLRPRLNCPKTKVLAIKAIATSVYFTFFITYNFKVFEIILTYRNSFGNNN